jgi:hypothetical protein
LSKRRAQADEAIDLQSHVERQLRYARNLAAEVERGHHR